MNINNLGLFLDGWAELVEGRGDNADEIRNRVFANLSERNMPEVRVSQVNGSVGIASRTRPYNITATHPNSKTAIYIAQHGQDLYVSWRTFIKPLFNVWIFVVFGLALFCAPLTFFVSAASWSPYSFASATTMFLNSVAAAAGVTIAFLFFLVVVLAALGLVLRGRALAFFYVEVNTFDAEDITAMSLSVHKSIIHVLDASGIDVSKLRLKQTFKGGRTRETV